MSLRRIGEGFSDKLESQRELIQSDPEENHSI